MLTWVIDHIIFYSVCNELHAKGLILCLFNLLVITIQSKPDELTKQSFNFNYIKQNYIELNLI